MRFTLKNPLSLQYIDYQNVRKTEFLGCQSQDTFQLISLFILVDEDFGYFKDLYVTLMIVGDGIEVGKRPCLFPDP